MTCYKSMNDQGRHKKSSQLLSAKYTVSFDLFNWFDTLLIYNYLEMCWNDKKLKNISLTFLNSNVSSFSRVVRMCERGQKSKFNVEMSILVFHTDVNVESRQKWCSFQVWKLSLARRDICHDDLLQTFIKYLVYPLGSSLTSLLTWVSFTFGIKATCLSITPSSLLFSS